MPLYTITTPEGTLSPAAKAALAAEITEFHSQMSGLDEAYTKIVFHSFRAGDGFIGREAGPAVTLTVKVRAGRPADYRRPARRMFRCCWPSRRLRPAMRSKWAS
jgi:phenylpyruvate tautomerase PptA (4-oxalocrotonate tautomerase family)